MAIASLICGVIGFCLTPVAIVALILGIIAMNKSRPGQPGRGMAVAGTVLGGVGIAVSIVALLIAILLPALGAARRTAQRMQNSTQLRGIHQGMITFANSNKNNYAGLNSKGDILADDPALTGNSGSGDKPQARLWILLNGSFFTPDYLISPSETDGAIAPYAVGSGPVDKDHYSYALLSFEKQNMTINDPTTQGYPPTAQSLPRVAEWQQTLNSQAILVSDRNTGTNADTQVQSIHTDSPGDWRGSVLWGDNHVAFENQPTFETKYANGMLNPQDNLFLDEPPSGANNVAGANALMDRD
jgi:type II secretory pathway pseudopilin PulG